MRVLVPVKYVPDIQADRRFGEDGRVVRTLSEGTLNELDEVAVEAALRVVEGIAGTAREEHEVVALTVGPQDADLALRKAYQLGVDRAIRVTDDRIAGSDYFSTAAVLASAVRYVDGQTPVDAVITGMAALDSLGSVIPALLAAELDWPQLLLARSLKIEGGSAAIERELDGVTESLTAELPAVVSVTDHIAAPRYPNFSSIIAARTKPIDSLCVDDLDIDPALVGDTAARTSVTRAAPRPEKEPVIIHIDKGDGGQALADFLIARGLV
ncbi:electron transfer flavoprotein subunit beta/FixA family protein [Rarobacter faecitabidus]|uniref:Electron transfer flavoprotein subunit beta n=1 Tax=Rarobacter faecitabidus TaxID=13243 RepID=A0A542ZXD3_RARFA|nr:electron transfer flavoprotein subunit beta/FixA family protein [Rarobacter faecitabidus]TQL64870.1 electron transfer flavoprotein beta subunit [Rarobacter faecitabidus]